MIVCSCGCVWCVFVCLFVCLFVLVVREFVWLRVRLVVRLFGGVLDYVFV